MKHTWLLISAYAFLACNTVAEAMTSDWMETPGGRVRIVIEDQPVEAGAEKEIRGALQIDLLPGWKTYWRNPGDSGVPPQVNLEKGNVEIAFPAPTRFGDAHESGIGYKQPVSLPLTFKLQPGDTRLKGNVFLGVCANICIPVQAEFDLPLTESDAQSASAIATRILVDTAFSRLPEAATETFGVKRVTRNADEALFELALPDKSAPAELFVASDTVSLSLPSPTLTADGKQAFTTRISGKADNAIVDYTLIQNGRAVSGRVSLD
ncbi:protein-disulfide reductase DsbD domain-containing protein [Daeguia caeni]|uniref:Protein-disulfide reductase DsbD domain-containing protein n=1 Tax=Daeguia caeni TaxID=439612 RepID=A0ABV9H478_9HYPH